MWLSQVPELSQLSVEQKNNILYGEIDDTGVNGDVILLLGSKPPFCPERAQKAAELYHQGRAPYIMPSGGVTWQLGSGEVMSEAHYMKRLLLELGVPEQAILLENEARTTKENLIYGVLQINRELQLKNVKTILIATSAQHMRRSMALAKWLLPRTVTACPCPAYTDLDRPDAWYTDAEIRQRGETNLRLLKGLVDDGLVDDISFT